MRSIQNLEIKPTPIILCVLSLYTVLTIIKQCMYMQWQTGFHHGISFVLHKMMENADIRKRGELLASFYIIMIIKPEVKNPNVASQNRKKMIHTLKLLKLLITVSTYCSKTVFGWLWLIIAKDKLWLFITDLWYSKAKIDKYSYCFNRPTKESLISHVWQMEKLVLRSCIKCQSLRFFSSPTQLSTHGIHTTASLRQKAGGGKVGGWRRIRRGLLYGIGGATASSGILYAIADEPQRRKVRVLLGGIKRFFRLEINLPCRCWLYTCWYI